jgi:hypothetical protein
MSKDDLRWCCRGGWMDRVVWCKVGVVVDDDEGVVSL